MTTKKLNLGMFLLAQGMFAVILAACSSSSTSTNTTPNATVATQSTTSTIVEGCDTSAPTFASGSGTTTSPYVISTFCHLLSLSYSYSLWGSSFVLSADLNLQGLTFNPMVTLSGTFDGQGHSISNWANGTPLFTVNKGTIQNLNLVNVTMVPMGGTRPAPLVGTNMAGAIVSNCTVTGTVNGIVPANLDSDSDIYWFVGGLVSINAGSIRHSSANVAVSGRESIGGLVGYNNGGTIQTSSAAGNVTATSSGGGQGVGGLVGTLSSGSIINSYATGSVTGTDQVGGLVGFLQGTVQNSFSSGNVVGTGVNLGGLIGQSTGGTVNSSYWDQTTSGQAASAGGTAELTSAMQSQVTFAGWDFSGTWNSPSGGYPSLK